MKTKLKTYFLLANISFFAVSSVMAQTTSSDYDAFLAGIVTGTGKYDADYSLDKNQNGSKSGNNTGNSSQNGSGRGSSSLNGSGSGSGSGSSSGNAAGQGSSSGSQSQTYNASSFSQGALQSKYSSTEALIQDRDRYLNQSTQLSGSTMEVKADDAFEDLIERKSATLYDDVDKLEDTYLQTQKRTWNLRWLMRLLKALFVIVPTIDGPANAAETVEVAGAGSDTVAAAKQEKTAEKIKDAYGSDNLSEYGIEAPQMNVESLASTHVTILSGTDLSDMGKISEVTEANILVQPSTDPKVISNFNQKKEIFIQENVIEILAKVLYIKKQIIVLKQEMDSLAQKAANPENKDQELRYQYQAYELYSKMLAYHQVLVSLKLQLGAVKGLKNTQTFPSSLLNAADK